MFDLRWIRDHPDTFDAGLARRALAPMAERIIALDANRRQAQTQLQELQTRRNEASKSIGMAKKSGDSADALIAEVADIKRRMTELEENEKATGEELDGILSGLPNLPRDDVPDGTDESANVCLRTEGKLKNFDFEPKQHFEVGAALDDLDFETAAKLSGSRFVVMRGAIARLHRALGQFMIDLHTREHGYCEVIPPLLVRDHVLYGTGQLPKFGEDCFRTAEGFWLIPTAEVPLTNLVADSILDAEKLPIRMTALTPCFRSEAGAAGKDTRGMLRQHQFEKTELVSIVEPEESDSELERMTGCAEEVLKRLGLPYRVMVLSTGDMGFGARRTHDIEVWLPGQNTYREISSCSTCGDFQARRMKTRYRKAGEKGTSFVHTLNGSGVAVGRCLIAVIENYQQADGSVIVPEALRPYTGGMEVLRADD
jgi:seryl-tRNA synthetase